MSAGGDVGSFNRKLEFSDLSLLEKGLMTTGLFTSGLTLGLMYNDINKYNLILAAVVGATLLGTNASLVYRTIKEGKNKEINYEIK